MNETNTVPYLNEILKVNDTLLGLPALPLVALGCIAWGYFLKTVPIYRNRWIPTGVFLFGIVLNLLITPVQGLHDGARIFILGMLAGGVAWVAHRKLLSRWIDDRMFQSSDTVQFNKPKDEK